MGGGNRLSRLAQFLNDGLSPRGRGKHEKLCSPYHRRGSIPAWAGETQARPGQPAGSEVYPRVGGGNPTPEASMRCGGGLSPRGRGKLDRSLTAGAGSGSIPAWAGETGSTTTASIRFRVYPRVGGGNCTRAFRPAAWAGLSPRGRGKRRGRPITEINVGSIPAWAGETTGTNC